MWGGAGPLAELVAPPVGRRGRPPGPTVERTEEEKREHTKDLRQNQYARRRFVELSARQRHQKVVHELAVKKEVRMGKLLESTCGVHMWLRTDHGAQNKYEGL